MDNNRLELLYTPVETREELKQHIKTFLKIDLPDSKVDEDSTSCPMDLVWSIYKTMLTGKGPQRVVAACARNSMKTLSAAIIRFYSMVHFRRSGTHLAATLDQSVSFLMYLDRFITIDGVAEYITLDNTRAKILDNLPENSFTKNRKCTLRVAVATKKGVNSQRGSFNTKDEVDLLAREIISEAAYIADPTMDEHRFGPIELNLSSRKIADGPIQDMIDEATSTDAPEDIALHTWSLVDFMAKCPDEIHMPEKGNIKAYLHTDSLRVIWGDEEFNQLSFAERSLYKEINAYKGCKTCPAFIACQARAPKQKGKSVALRDIGFVGVVLKSVKDPDSIISQALNWRPGKSGNVFKTFRKNRHFRKLHDSYLWLFGEYFNPHKLSEEELEIAAADKSLWWKITPTKADIYERLVVERWTINYGVDWGFSPARATCVVWAYHKRRNRACCIHVESTQELANQDWANHIAKEIWHSRFPGDLMCPDLADKASPSYFSKHKIPSLKEKPSRINTGVSQLRSLLFNPNSQQEDLIIIDDESEDAERLCNSFEKWTHEKTPLGFDHNKFEDDDNCDFIDPSRYALAPFVESIDVNIAATQNFKNIQESHIKRDAEAHKEYQEKQFKDHVREFFRDEIKVDNIFKVEEKKEEKPKKSGPIKFRF